MNEFIKRNINYKKKYLESIKTKYKTETFAQNIIHKA